jgi:anti-repressor protein
MEIMIAGQQQTMTSREIADLVESRHDKVKQSIERLAARHAIGLPPVGEYLDNLGRPAHEYLLCKRDSYVVVAQLSPAFTARLVDRWQELEAAQPKALDLNDPQALRAALLGYTEKVLQLETKVAADAPKVAFAEVIRAMDGVCHIGEFCKTMRIGRNRMFKRMKEDKILMASRMPYQKYIDKGYFSVIEQTPYTNSKGETHTTFTTMVTGAGQVFLARRYADMIGIAK